jgi:hypothetical protein
MNRLPEISTIGRVCANDEPVNRVEIIIHINEILDSVTRNGLQSVMLRNDGVFAADFCPRLYHVLLVQYDRSKLSSRSVLALVVSQKLTAQIIGPI